MVPSFGTYISGSIGLLAIAAALGTGGYQLRRWLTPEFSGALARLAELVLAISMLVVTLQLLGSFGLLYEGPVIAACITAGAGAALLGRSKAGPPAGVPQVPAVPLWALLAALAVAAVAIAEWTIPVHLNLHQGIFSGDSVWYHMPFAARFAQSHSTWHLHFTDPLRLSTWFYPASSELLNSIGILLFRSDWLMPLTNLAWLAVGLLSAYCVGRPYGAGPATLVAGAIALDSGVLVTTQAGEARNDAMAIALLLAFAALIVNSNALSGSQPREGAIAAPLARGPLIVSGLAGGLAISVKLTILPPVAMITLLAIVLARGRRPQMAGLLVASGLASGGYWYLRNLAHSGNPVPQVYALGPIKLPHPQQMPLYPRPPSSVADYLTNGHVIRAWFLPQLDNALGPLYAVILGIALVAAVYAIVDSRGRAVKAVGLGALAGAAVYLVTPLTAAGPPGEPDGFFTNTRYLMPALTLGLVLFPLASPLLKTTRRVGGVLGLLVAVFGVGLIGTWPSGSLPGVALIDLALVVAAMVLAVLGVGGRLRRVAIAVAGITALAGGVAAGRSIESGYAEHHYGKSAIASNLLLSPVETLAWAQRLKHARIAIAGAGGLFFHQYLFYGADLTNWVQYIGKPGPHGQYTEPPTCAVLRRQVARGNYDYLVLSQGGQGGNDAAITPRAWTAHVPELREVRSEKALQEFYVYKVTGRLTVNGC